MPTDKKISELPIASSISATDTSILVDGDTDYQYTFTLLLQFLEANLSTGANISFGTVLPQNTSGQNDDMFVNTAAGSFAQKISGTWTVVYTLPAANAADGTMLYGAGLPGSGTGKNGDSFINTLTGVFYQKSAGAWGQVFSMATGPQGPQGTAGTNGSNGSNGNTILFGATDPSNTTTGVNGNFYINTSTYALFGPKTSGIWGDGVSILGTGIAAGGSAGQILKKVDGADYNTDWQDNSFANLTGLPADNANLSTALNTKAAITYVDANDAGNLVTAKTYADSLLVSVYKDCGNWDASTGTFPTTGGTGSGGTIKAGNAFEISVAGTIAGEAFDIGDTIRALVDAPGQTLSNWATSAYNQQQATETNRGTAKIVTQTTIQTETSTDDQAVVTTKKFWQGLARFIGIPQTITGNWNFTGTLKQGGNIVETQNNKDASGGYAGLNSSGNFNKNTDNLSEGSSNLWFTASRVLATVLTGIGFSSATAISATDSLLAALGKLQAQLTALFKIPTGGTSGQVLAKVDGTDGNTHWVDTGGDLTLYALKADTGDRANLITTQKGNLVRAINELKRKVSALTVGTLPSITDLVVDFNFSDTTKVTVSSGKVSQILDEISSLVSAQTIGANQPAYINDGSYSGGYFARFVGSQILTGSLFSSSTDFTMFVIRKVNHYTGTKSTWGYGVAQNGNSAVAGYGFVDYQAANPDVGGFFYPGVSIGNLAQTFAAKWELSVISHSSGSDKIYNTLGAVLYSGNYATPNTPTGGHIIGNVNYSGVDPFNGDLARVMMYDRQLSDSEVLTMCKYLYALNTLNLPAHIVFGGDSKMTALGGSPDVPDQLAVLLTGDNEYFYVKNTAVAGRLIADLMTNLPAEILTPYQPDVINIYAVMVGHNDVAASRTAVNIYADIVTLCQTIQDQGYKVIIMTDLYATVASNSVKDTINASIRANWTTFADALADTNALPNAADPSNATYFGDGLHPTALLGADIASLLKPIFEALLTV